MKKRVLIFTILILNISAIFAQQIKGKVLSEDSLPIPACTVSLINDSIKKTVKFSVTNAKGEFEISSLSDGIFSIAISHIGEVNKLIKNISFSKNVNSDLGIIILQKNKTSLKEVVVTSQKPLVEIKADRMQINVEGTINAVGSDALELIRKSPGVAVDKDDNIQMSGKSGVQIYIDGKPSPLTGEDLANYLKAIQSSQIDVLELITNPSAKYEAAGNGGIINIKLKKNKTIGTNGSIQSGYAVGIKSKYNAGFNINHRTKKINIFSNYNYNNAQNVVDFKLKRTLADTIFELKADRGFDNITHGFKTGLDFFQNKTTTWGLLINGTFANTNNSAVSETPIIARNTNIISRILNSTSNQKGNDNNINFNLNYKYVNAKSQSLNIDVDYGNFAVAKNLYQPNVYFSGDGVSKLSEVNYNLISSAAINIYSFKTDYEQPFAKGILGIGGKFASITSDNNFKFFNVLSTNISNLDIAKSNQFNYRENINALYVNYNRNWKKIQLQAGLRGEHSSTSGVSYALLASENIDYSNSKNFSRNYLNLFPSIGVSYIQNANVGWNITAGRRVDRPNYQDLNPFEFKVDEYTSRKGNTDLVPQFSYNVAITNTYKSKLISKIGYSNIVNLIGRLVDTINGNRNFITPKNLGTQNVLFLFESYQIQQNWYSGTLSVNAYYTTYKADLGGGNRIINTSAKAAILTMQNSFKLGHNWTTELNGSYNSTTVVAASVEKQKWGIDIGVQKIILNGQGNIKFSATDIFWTNFDRSGSNFGAQIVEGSFRRESKQYKINFTYRFGNKQLKTNNNRASGTEEEIKRSQGGNG